ncbi:putative cytochrome b5 [Trypanosoma cruzi]|uniref:Cytochrome b5, putative n=2 Tax=Trypanosoma cruzi TaxID=5693 RepID=Q4DUS3_TRYCC|nr:cytochrome b5, putative [Trypanosoma cruzi]EAN96281.1 cytochrome b5, putative [Trypanosoma cruzi]PWV12889.1 putative cytochrome b5 [Trypanosoma cruzi]RNC44236.1 cytochrome b5 [Trypanosoma cruzi]|eukprot:XP_818132.1 cytochrome b5 [Trypanosoma cruzi strain CL Brener]
MLKGLLQIIGLKKEWPVFTLDEVRQHNDRSSIWIVAGNSVYDVTHILDTHPGGLNALLRRGGGVKDCTEDFYFHSRAARRTWNSLKIGELDLGEAMGIGTLAVSLTDSRDGSSAPEASPVSHACASWECDGGKNCCCTSTVETHGSTSEPVPERLCSECLHRHSAWR